jgi:hypothetical protein
VSNISIDACISIKFYKIRGITKLTPIEAKRMISLFVPDSQYDAVKHLAWDNHVSQSEVIRLAIAAYLERQELEGQSGIGSYDGIRGDA